METLRQEMKPFGVQVAMVEPGSIRTPFYAAPDVPATTAYSPWRERFSKTMKGFEQKAPGPEVVAEVFSRIVRSERPALRNRVTMEATLFPLMRWLLPSSMFEGMVRVGFGLERVRVSAALRNARAAACFIARDLLPSGLAVMIAPVATMPLPQKCRPAALGSGPFVSSG